MTAPTYAAYAVKAWLRNNSPCTVYRVLGEEAGNAVNDANGKAGWKTDNDLGTASTAGGAYGMLVFPSASATTPVTGTLAAVWYVQEGYVQLSGVPRETGSGDPGTSIDSSLAGIASSNGKFTVKIKNGSDVEIKTATFDFNRDSETFIRKVFNTDPTATNDDIVGTAEKYWLGETFESNLRNSENSKLKELIVTDSIPQKKESKKVNVLTCANLFADVMHNVNNNQSINPFFIK